MEAEDNARKVKNVQMIFAAEQTWKENAIIKKQKEEIERKNKELLETIDELTRTRISRKARAITFTIAIILFILEDSILHFALTIVPEDSYWLSMAVKIAIIFSLSPINKAIEKYRNELLRSQNKDMLRAFDAAVRKHLGQYANQKRADVEQWKTDLANL